MYTVYIKICGFQSLTSQIIQVIYLYVDAFKILMDGHPSNIVCEMSWNIVVLTRRFSAAMNVCELIFATERERPGQMCQGETD